MSYRWFVQEVARRAELTDMEAAERAVVETLRGLGWRLSELDARAVASQLPPSLADVFLSAGKSAPELERATAVLSQRANDRAVRAACRLLAETLDEQARAQLRMQPLTALFV